MIVWSKQQIVSALRDRFRQPNDSAQKNKDTHKYSQTHRLTHKETHTVRDTQKDKHTDTDTDTDTQTDCCTASGVIIGKLGPQVRNCPFGYK